MRRIVPALALLTACPDGFDDQGDDPDGQADATADSDADDTYADAQQAGAIRRVSP